MSTTLWIALGVAVALVVGYVFAMRNLVHRSREADKKIDRSKIHRLKDDDEW